MKNLDFFSRWPVILTSFILMNLVGISFYFAQQAIDGDLLDMIWSGAEAKQRLAEMTAAQKKSHILATATADTLYPLAYGSFFIGLTARLSGSRKLWLFIPALCAVCFDLTENITQLIGLFGHPDILIIKDLITPAKFISVLVAGLVILVLIVVTIARKISRSQ